MTWFARARARLRDDSGVSLPEVMVGVVVSALCMGVIAGGIISLTAVSTTAAGAAAASQEQQQIEARWRSDVRAAVAIDAQDPEHMTFTALGAEGACVENAWAIDAETTAVTIHTRVFPDFEAGSCVGEVTTDLVITVTKAAGAQAAFTAVNAAGRHLVFVDGTVVPDAQPAPAGVTVEDWDSTDIAVVDIGFEAVSGTEWATKFSVSQRTGAIWSGPDAPTHSVPSAPAPEATP